MEYRSRLADIGVVLKAKNCLVFQGQVEMIATMTAKERCTILDEFSGYVKSTIHMTDTATTSLLYSKKSKVLPEPHGPSGGTELRFHSPQPDTSLRCQTTDTGLVHRAVCLFTPLPKPVAIYTSW